MRSTIALASSMANKSPLKPFDSDWAKQTLTD